MHYSLFFGLIIHYSLYKKNHYSLIIIPHPDPLKLFVCQVNALKFSWCFQKFDFVITGQDNLLAKLAPRPGPEGWTNLPLGGVSLAIKA